MALWRGASPSHGGGVGNKEVEGGEEEAVGKMRDGRKEKWRDRKREDREGEGEDGENDKMWHREREERKRR